MNGVEIKFGKNVLPSSIARCVGEMACSTDGGISSPIGLYPRNAPKSAAVGGRCAMAIAIAHLPPTAALFGAFLGYNPIGELIPPSVLQAISPTHRAILLGKTFFPNLISTPFMDSLHAVFYISAAMCLIGAAASLLRGKRVVYRQE